MLYLKVQNNYFSLLKKGEKRMKKVMKKTIAFLLAFVMVSATFFQWMPAMTVQAEESTSKMWIDLTPGSSTGGGHSYSGASGPMFYTHSTERMVPGGTISMTLKPGADNWGVFYSYIDDNNWLYIGHDGSSNWYYQYRINGAENYPQISGLPNFVAGEEFTLTISLSNETLEVTVDGTTQRVTNQKLKELAETFEASHGNLGKFGIMAKNRAVTSFADFTYDSKNLMDETQWEFNVNRNDGSKAEVSYTAMKPISGTVTDVDGKPVEGATVRVGSNATTTDVNGNYSFEGIQVGEYNFAVTKAGYEAFTDTVTLTIDDELVVKDAVIEPKAPIDLLEYDMIESDDMTVYIGKEFPVVARYVMKSDETAYFRGNETDLKAVVINGVEIVPEVKVVETTADSRTYELTVEDVENGIDFVMDVRVSVEGYNLTWEVTELTKNEGCVKIATIDIPHLNLLTVDATETESVFAGAQVSTTTTNKADTYITFEDGFVPSNEAGYLYAFLTNGKLSAGVHSNSEREGDKRVERINTADTMSLTSAAWYYESGDAATGQARANIYDYQVSELPQAKVAIANGDLNGDGDIDWNDGAIAFRDVMHYAQGNEVIKDTVNYRIVMNFESAAPNPFLVTADNVKKVYLATDGLPQALLLKGYGNEGHDSANSEYADIAVREGGVEDFQTLIEIAHDYNTEVGIHVNAQEAYPEARSFNETMVGTPSGGLQGNGWGWLDQSVVINKLWDLASDARLKRFVQLYDRINETEFLSLNWDEKEYVKDSQGTFLDNNGNEVSRLEVMELVKTDAATREDNMDFIYLDVWYQDAWETRRIAEEINSMGWRFSTEFSAEGEYDSTWQHWSTDTTYGGAGAKGLNSDIIRFLRNDQRDSQVLNWPAFGGTADNPLLGGFRLYGFEGWGGQQDFDQYIYGTFTENVPTKFLQHYEVIDWENYEKGESPVGNTEKQITLTNGEDVVVVTRNEEQRSDIEIERTITLNGKVVLNTDVAEHTYLLPWIDNQNGEEKLYHWNEDGGTTTWELQDDWAALKNVVVYELSDQGRINEETVAVVDGTVTLTADASVAYVVVKGAAAKELVADFGEAENVVDPGFNGYANDDKLDAADWSGDINAEGVKVVRTNLGDQKLEMTNTEEDVAVSVKLTGLTAGEDYVAELYVANESDARATLSVNTGSKEVSVYTDRSIAQNYISCDSEHGTKMNRMQVSFVAEGEEATLTLSRTAGEGYTHWDDIRIVEQRLDNYREDGSFVQDFESVVQGLYPFVLGYNAGGDSRTHLSQLNAPYTQKGWNGKSVDDVLGGEWSLKHHTNITGLAYRTIPQNFRFEPGKVYNVEFDYQTISGGYQMVVGDGTNYNVPTTYLPTTSNGTGHASMQVVGSGSGQTWIGLYMNGSRCYSDTAIGSVDFILDNLMITEDSDAVAVTIDKTEMYLGESAEIFGAGLERVTWSADKEGIVAVDKESNRIDSIGTGTVTLTAAYGEGETKTFTITVIGTMAVEMSKDLYTNLSAEANTEETVGEGAGNGVAASAVDGNSNTFWHTSWYSDGSFSVSESSPAVLTFDFGETVEIGGFMMQNRSNRSDRGIVLYNYQVLDAEDNVLVEKTDVKVDSASQQAGAWITELLDENVAAKKVVVTIRKANSNDGSCAVAEFKPVLVEKVATDATLEDAEVEVGATIALEAVPVGGTTLKGLVWTSSDETVATVNANGVVTGIKAGTATITVSNALGELATATVTVTGEVEEKGEVCKVFTDVEHDAWYEDSVQYVYDEGIIVGDGNVFAPNDATTRAMVAVILYRLAGSPKVTEADYAEYNKFEDLPKEHVWYSDAVAWALKEKVSTGDDVNMKYNPTSAVTREQLALFLWRYAKYTGKDTSVEATYEELFGETYVDDWAKEGFAWAVENGVIKGAEATDAAGNTYFDLNPQGGATRAQFARVLHRYVGGATE